MAYHWEGDGFRSQEFPTRVDAEAWLTSCYLDLLDAGVTAVTLLDEASVVYGPMSLEP